MVSALRVTWSLLGIGLLAIANSNAIRQYNNGLKTYYLPFRLRGVDYTKYDLYQDKVYVHKTTSIVFKTKGKHDCHVLLKQDVNDYFKNVIEIVIGGWSNTQSVIRTAQQGSARDTHIERGLVSPKEYRTFWISWANKCIKVGKGASVGSNEFLTWCGLTHSINYISIGYGFGSSGFFQFYNVQDGHWGDWGPYGACTKSCGLGIQTRFRSCNNPEPSSDGANCVGSSTETRDCNVQTCPGLKTYYLPFRLKDVDYTKYDLYKDKVYVHKTTSIVFKTKGKHDCHVLLKQDANDYFTNVIEIVIGGWFNTHSVIRTAQQGTARDRHIEKGLISPKEYRTFWISWVNRCIKVGKGTSVGSNEFLNWCGLSHSINYISIGYGFGSSGYFQFFTVQDGNWGDWGPYGACTKSCGSGIQTRTRACDNPAPSSDGANCVGSSTETRDCNTQACPVDGNWGIWGPYSACTKTCGTGTQTRTRVCDNPAPSGGGGNCNGTSSQTRPCNTKTCPDCDEETFLQQCAIDPASYFAVPNTNCTSFYQCQALTGGGYELRSQNCPDGLQFDIRSNICDYPSAVTCSGCVEEEPFIQQCAIDPASYFIVPNTNCTSFSQCQALTGGGYELRSQNCPDGLQFDIRINVCNYPIAVTCSGRQ